METQSQIFDFKRFMNTVRNNFALNSRQIGIRLLSMFGTIVVVFILGAFFHMSGPANVNNRELMFDLWLWAFSALGASCISDNMKSPAERLNTIMLPSSTLEKYISLILIYVAGTFIAFIASYIVGDLVQMLFTNLYYDGRITAEFNAITTITDALSGKIEIPILLGTQATFVLGAVIWPKNSFMKTIASIWVFQMLLTIVFVVTIHLSSNSFHIGRVETHDLICDVETVFQTAVYIWTVFCYVTAYFRLRESEIINRF